MKTAMQELLQVESDLTRMFDSDLMVAMRLLEYIRANKTEMLEKEKWQIMNAYDIGWLDCKNSGSTFLNDQYYFETFDTNGK
jgi:hypothetical protein